MGRDIIRQFDSSDKIVLSKTTFTEIRSNTGNGFSNTDDFQVVNGQLEVTLAITLGDAKIVYDRSAGNLYYKDSLLDGLLDSPFATLAPRVSPRGISSGVSFGLTANNFVITD